MEISTNISTPTLQTCPHCGEQNPIANAFCQKCGQILQQPLPEPATQSQAAAPLAVATTEKKGGKMKVVLIVIVLLAFLGAAAGAGYYWYQQKLKKDAREFISTAVDNFNKAIAGINQLSTEKNINEEETDNIDLIIKKLEEEQSKLDLLQQDIKSATENLAQNPANKLAASTESLLKQFYQESNEKSDTYEQFIAYNIRASKEISKFVAEMEKLKNSTKTVTSVEELKNVFVSLRAGIDNANNSLKAITPPSGMEEAHNKSVDMFTQISKSLTGVITAIEEQNEQKFIESLGVLDEAFADTKRLKEIRELEKYYFDELHKKFVALREKADKIKAEFIGYKAPLHMEVKDISIEGW